MKYALHIRTDGSIDQVQTETLPLSELQRLVGGYIEVVHPRGLLDPYCFVVDEEGLLKRKPINALASCLYGGSIAGDVVVLADGYNADGERDLVGLSDEQVIMATLLLREASQRFTRAGQKNEHPQSSNL